MTDAGTIAIFPLPNVVHFPDTDLRLHIFEPRYRQLINDLIERPKEERLIGMVLQSGPPPDADTPPPVHPLGTAGQLIEVELNLVNDSGVSGAAMLELNVPAGIDVELDREDDEVAGADVAEAMLKELAEVNSQRRVMSKALR